MLPVLKEKVLLFKNDNRGDFGIKSLAMTVGAIVVISAVVVFLTEGQITVWVTDVWDTVWQWIQNMVK